MADIYYFVEYNPLTTCPPGPKRKSIVRFKQMPEVFEVAKDEQSKASNLSLSATPTAPFAQSTPFTRLKDISRALKGTVIVRKILK